MYPTRKIWDRTTTPDHPRIEHNVPCGGTLRECPICGEVRYCGREGQCLNDQQPTHWVRRQFDIEGLYGGGIWGWTRGEHWNGWACPRFEFSAALEVIVFNNEPPVGTARFDPETDTVIVHWQNDEEQRYEGEIIETAEGPKKVYAIGAWAWIWEEVNA